MKKLILACSLLFLYTCTKKNETSPQNSTHSSTLILEEGMTIKTRYETPKNFERAQYQPQEFGYFLQQLPLKPYGSTVKYFNGEEKLKSNVYNAVIDLPIGHKDLHQCADAAMRLWADFLYENKRYDEISFNFVSDNQPRKYVDYANGDYSPTKYWKYLEYIFSYANTASLKRQLRSIDQNEVQIGDILLQSGNPYGHAVIVVDLVKDKNENTLVLLAQSYMPAQELQILNNPNASNNSPWYNLDQDEIITPEWRFTKNDWKTWQ